MKKTTGLWIIWILLLTLYMFMAGVIMGGAEKAVLASASNPECTFIPDLKFSLTKSQLLSGLDCMGNKSLAIYRQAEVREDIIYIFCYGCFFIFTLFRLSFYLYQRKKLSTIISMIPAAVMTADLLENFYLLKIVDSFPDINAVNFNYASFFNTLKWSLIFIALCLLLILLVLAIVKLIRVKRLSLKQG